MKKEKSDAGVNIGKIFENLREGKDLKKNKAAEKIGISRTTLYKVEKHNGGLKNLDVRPDTLDRLLEFYEIDLDFLDADNSFYKAMQKAKASNVDDEDEKLGLVDKFENAINKYGIIGFVNADYPFIPIQGKTVEAISDFIEYIRGILPTYRHHPQTLIADFVNEVDDYSIFLALQLEAKDNETYVFSSNIDRSIVLENTTSFRRNLNEIYGKINAGGCIYTFK